jgi:hypothetical protein
MKQSMLLPLLPQLKDFGKLRYSVNSMRGKLKHHTKGGSFLAVSKNPVFHEHSKHINIQYPFIRGCMQIKVDGQGLGGELII